MLDDLSFKRTQALLAVLLFDEKLGAQWFVGAVMILSGVYLIATQNNMENITIDRRHIEKEK